MPRLDPALLSEHEVSIVGTDAGEQVRDLAAGLPHMKVVGWVPSVIPYLNSARVSVVPLRYGAGTKRKIVQALMVGTPTVTTRSALRASAFAIDARLLIADDPSEFAAGIERLLQRRLAWRGLARRGRRHILRLHGRAAVEARFDQVLEAVLARRARPAPVKPVADDGTVDDGIVRKPDYAQLIRQGARTRRVRRPGGRQGAGRDPRGRRVPGPRGTKRVAFPPRPRREVRGLLPRRHGGRDRTPRGATSRGRHAPGPAADRASGGWTTTRGSEPTSISLTARSGATSTRSFTSWPARLRLPYRRSAGPEDDVTSEALRRLQPSALAAASRYRNGNEPRRALVLGHLPGREAEHGRARRRHLRRAAAISRSSSAGSRSEASPRTESSDR